MKLAIFDIDGTLTRAEFDNLYERTLSEVFGAPIDTDWGSYPHATDSSITYELFRRHRGREPTDAEIAAVRDRYLEGVRTCGVKVEQVPGAAAALAHLDKLDDWSVAIATGNWGVSGRFKLASAGIGIDGIPFASADDAHSREDVMRAALARAGGPFERTVYVGDAGWDVTATRNLGMPFVGIGDGLRLLELGASHALSDLRDVALLLDALAAAETPSL